jgi:hypothetical protein
MTPTNKTRSIKMEWFKVDENILAELRPGVPFNARASFQVFG